MRISRAAAALLAAAAALSAPKKELTLERVSGGRGAEPPIVARGASRVAWRDAEHVTFLAAEKDGDEPHLLEADVATGTRHRLLPPLTAPDDPKRTLSESGAVFSPDGKLVLLHDSPGEDLYLFDLAAKTTRRLTKDADEEELPSFSPDGRRLAWVKRNDLVTLELASGKETRLTTSGSETVFNGKLDWVYEEELAERRSGRSYEWAPDSSALAYLRLDESRVPVVPIVDHLTARERSRPQRYPLPGDPNPVASVRVVDVAGRETASLEVADGGYVGPELTFTRDSRAACAVLVNRAQDERRVVLLPRDAGAAAAPRVLVTEKDPAWINALDPPLFLADGGFLLVSERTGFFHLDRHDAAGRLLHAVTQGSWMIDGVPDLDEKNGQVLYASTEPDPRERQLWRVRLDGSGKTRLSSERGTHAIDLAPGGAHYVDRVSGVASPPRLVLHRADGTQVAVLDETRSSLGEYEVGTTELSSFTGKDGTLFYTRLTKPAHFDPAKKYPVLVFVYGGPHVQVVQDRWGTATLFDAFLAEKGFLVFSMDGRGSWGRGHAFETPILKNLLAQELADQLEGVAWLKSRPYVDGARIGISGWSYGGTLALYAATHAGGTFKAAIAGAPVADWRRYDSIYTERYMKLPDVNAEGYVKSAPLTSVANLGSKLLLVHGTSDDNVHFGNTIALVDALARARKDFTFLPLPRQAHGPRDAALRLYTNQRVLEFLEKNL